MTVSRFLTWGAVVAICVTTQGLRATADGGSVDGKAAFERLKSLQGTWETAGGQKATTTFELVANGTVLLERYSNPAIPGGGQMVSAYHLDGTALVLTHYCGFRSYRPVALRSFPRNRVGDSHAIVRRPDRSWPPR